MNRKLSDQQIRSTYESLSRCGELVSGRTLRMALRTKFGASGKTARVFAICRSLQRPAISEPADIAALRRELEAAERGRAHAEQERDQALARAVLSEERELAHQDRWANQIYELRQQMESLRGEGARRRALEEQVARLMRELQGLRPRDQT
jgi:hypothetical protein